MLPSGWVMAVDDDDDEEVDGIWLSVSLSNLARLITNKYRYKTNSQRKFTNNKFNSKHLI